MTSEDIKRRKWIKSEREAVRRAAESQAAGDDSLINFADIPRLTKARLASMVRLGDLAQPIGSRTEDGATVTAKHFPIAYYR